MKASIEDTGLMNQIEQLYLWHISTSEIGEVLGYTKNQIIGLVHRGRDNGYNFPKRDNAYWRTRAKKSMTLSAMAKYKMKENQNKSKKVKAAQYRTLVKVDSFPYLAIDYIDTEITEIPLEGLPLLKVPHNGCKFPIGQNKENTHLFCSQPKVESSYCAKHMKVMWPNRYK